MSKKRKKPEQIIITEKSKEYFEVWKLLSNAHEEHEFDSIRKRLNEMWANLLPEDKKCFHHLSK